MDIAVIDGGFSSEAHISYLSAATVYNNLDAEKYNLHRVRIIDQDWKYDPDGLNLSIDKNDFSVQLSDKKLQFDFAMIVIHGTPGEDGKLQAYFDLVNIPYSTADHTTATLTFNKYYCNRVLESYGIKCAKALLFRDLSDYSDKEIVETLGLPCFVKPNDGGSSFGASIVHKEEEIRDALKSAFEHGEQVIAEEFMVGTEVTNGVYHNGSSVHALPITEIVTQNEFFDYEAKYKGESEEITPARISDELSESIKKTTVEIYEKVGLEGVCRVDYIIRNGVPYVIEINTIPGQSEASLIPQMAAYEGISLKDLFGISIENALRKKID